MASVYKRVRNGKKDSFWTVAYQGKDGKRKTKKGFTDKSKSQQLGAKLEADARAINTGLVDEAALVNADNRRLPIADHVANYEAHLGRNKQTTEKHIKQTVGRIKRTIKAGGFESLSQMSHDKVESTIATMRDDAERLKKEKGKGRGFGAKTFNHYLSAFESFGKWLYESHRIDSNPFRGFYKMNTAVDVRKKRRPLTVAELNKLVKAARASNVTVEGYDGETRARIYTVAALTGLRRSEIATLSPESFSGLESGSRAMLKVEAACSKHRREDNMPVHDSLVTQLRSWLVDSEPGEPLFPKLAKRKTFEMIEKDLERADIPYKTADGDADFHSLRHTFISQLLSDGATVIETKELARHSDVEMTMRYSHVQEDQQRDALAKLDFDVGSESGSAMAARNCHNGSSDDNLDKQRESEETKKPHENVGLHEVCHHLSTTGRAEDTGVEPATLAGN